MKRAAQLIGLIICITIAYARIRGSNYEKELICGQYTKLGKDNFRVVLIVTHGRKFPNGTFEEVSAVVKEMVDLAEKCCDANADPNCYEEGSNAISLKSCQENSPFPYHPGVEQCCKSQGLELKLCLAALEFPPLEIPGYVEPSNEELCESLTKGGQSFTDKIAFEFSRRSAGAPSEIVHSSLASFLKMLSTCCGSPTASKCFAEQRILQKETKLLIVMTHGICTRYQILGGEKFKTRSVAVLAQKIPSAELNEIRRVSSHLINTVSKCCKEQSADCLKSELKVYKDVICNGTLPSKSEKLEECCSKGTTEALVCFHYLDTGDSVPWDESRRPSDEDYCKERPHLGQRVIYEVARTHTKLPVTLLSKISDVVQRIGDECCSAEDQTICLSIKRPNMKKEMHQYLEKAKDLCWDHNTNVFTVYKKKVQDSFREQHPEATEEELKALVDQRTEFASTCCIPRGPMVYCENMFKTLIGRTCDHETCLLS
ncbi:vitamin D-binding protein [Protopterus annectens]|uniref:vitamin D-binding protein n=1 Tax=Protopterus annectens TaxID=7888 RepID=UPI001CFB39C6|nr:vitamin D-binding protein [Protopterus annectens]